MSFTISDLKNRVSGKLHGYTLAKIPGSFNDHVFEAASNLLLSIDPVETKRIVSLTNALYDNVYDYVAPSDLKRDKIVDIRPQVSRTVSDNFSHQYSKEFDSYKRSNTFSVEYNSGVKTIRISKENTAGKTIHSGGSLTSNGIWAAGGDATNLTLDTYNYITGSGSLNFDVASAGSAAYIENSTMTAVDLSTWDEQASAFVFVYLPDASNVTNLILRWGNDTSNYWFRTVAQQHDQTAFRDGWNLLRFDWNGATEIGTVDPAAIDYLRLTVAYNGTADTDYRLDSVIFRLGTLYEIVYYSGYLFQNSAGTWIEKPSATDDSDIINLSSDTINLLTYELLHLLAQAIQGEDSSFDANFWEAKRNEVWGTYKRSHKSEHIKKQTSYYRVPRY